MTNFFRIGVPLFLMLSGALSLGRQWNIKSFLSKRLPRIVYPFLSGILYKPYKAGCAWLLIKILRRKIFTNMYLAVAVIIIMAIAEIIVSAYMSTPNKLYTVDRYSIFTTLEAIGVFVLCKNWKYRFLDKDNIANKFINLIARYSYGLYLVHAPILHIYLKFFRFPYSIRMPLLIIAVIGTSIILLAIFNRIPYVNRVIGVK